MVVVQASSAKRAQQTLAWRLLWRGIVKSIARTLMALTLAAAAFSTAHADGAGPVSLRGTDGRGQAFDLTALRGNVVALTFTSRYTQDEAERVHGALTGRAALKVVSVVDFVGIPSVVRGYARRKIVERDGRVLHLCDEQSALRGPFGARPDKQVDIFIIDREGGMRGHFVGAQLADALRLVEAMEAQARN
jgi:hypothetical protein